MIRRELDNSFFLIKQHDHGLLAAQLGQHLRPAPSAALLCAARNHDIGWCELDEQPTLNAHGFPFDVFEPGNPHNIQAWPKSVEQVSRIDPYAGLLVSMHTLQISMSALPRTDATDPATLAVKFAINRFQHREVERQEQLRRTLGLRTDRALTLGLADEHIDPAEDQLRYDLRLFQMLDVLSLHLCYGSAVPLPVMKVHPNPGGAPRPLSIRFDSDGDGRSNCRGTCRVEPWLFESPALELTIDAQSIPHRQYRSGEELAEAIRSASRIQLRVHCRG